MVSFDRVADTYDSTREAPRPEEMRALAKELAGCRSVLDLGAGTGRLARPLLDRGLNVTGVDLARRMLEVAVGKGVDRVVVGDACYLPFRSATFDAVLAVRMMHLVEDVAILLAEARRVGRQMLVTLADHYDPPDSPVEGYHQALAARGFWPRVANDSPELLLAGLIRPTTFAKAFASQVENEFATLIGILERREYSITWDVPDDLHGAAISEIKERYAGPRSPTYRETFLLSWNVSQFTETALRRAREQLTVSAAARPGPDA